MKFKVEEKCHVYPGMTISKSAKLSTNNNVTWFSMGEDTTISQEAYDTPVIYIGEFGEGIIILGEEKNEYQLKKGDTLYVPEKTLCGMKCDNSFVYTEIILNKETTMNKLVKSAEVFQLKDFVQYEEGGIANLDVASNDKMKMVLMSFDDGCTLSPHRAPGNAIVTALEGNATIGYESVDYELHAGESFRFDKNGLHSVTANGKFKMLLVLVLE